MYTYASYSYNYRPVVDTWSLRPPVQRRRVPSRFFFPLQSFWYMNCVLTSSSISIPAVPTASPTGVPSEVPTTGMLKHQINRANLVFSYCVLVIEFVLVLARPTRICLCLSFLLFPPLNFAFSFSPFVLLV